MRSQRVVSELIGLIYDAAADPRFWATFLEKLARELSATGTNIIVQDLRSQEFSIASAIGTDPTYQRAYENHYKRTNVYLTHGNHLLQSGKAYPSHVLCPDEVALRSEFFNDWIAPQKQRYGMMGVIFREKSVVSMLGAIRGKKSISFGEDQVALVRLLIPHLQRAVVLHRRIKELERQKAAASSALNRWSVGVILLDSQGRILLMNRKAEEIVDQNDGFVTGREGLRSSLAVETSLLRRLTRGAIQNGLGSFPPGGALCISRPSLKRPFNLLITPACNHKYLIPDNDAAAVVFVTDPEMQDLVIADVLRQLYHLTPAEATLGALLFEGKDLKGAAEALGVRMSTAKTHLQKVFDKTGTKRQAELVQMLLRSPAQIRSTP